MIYKNDSSFAIAELERERLFPMAVNRDRVITFCDACGAEIYSDEEFLEAPEDTYCKNCVTNMTSEDLLEVLGIKFSREKN